MYTKQKTISIYCERHSISKLEYYNRLLMYLELTIIKWDYIIANNGIFLRLNSPIEIRDLNNQCGLCEMFMRKEHESHITLPHDYPFIDCFGCPLIGNVRPKDNLSSDVVACGHSNHIYVRWAKASTKKDSTKHAKILLKRVHRYKLEAIKNIKKIEDNDSK